AAVLRVLKEYGYDSRDDAVFVQSFDHAELQRVRNVLLPSLDMDVRLVQLVADNSWLETYQQNAAGEWTPYDYSWMLTGDGLQQRARLVDGIGPTYGALVDVSGSDAMPNGIVAQAHAAGLQVHPFTFRKDSGQVPAYAESFAALLEFFLYDIDVDGVFTDFPDEAVRVIHARQR